MFGALLPSVFQSPLAIYDLFHVVKNDLIDFVKNA